MKRKSHGGARVRAAFRGMGLQSRKQREIRELLMWKGCFGDEDRHTNTVFRILIRQCVARGLDPASGHCSALLSWDRMHTLDKPTTMMSRLEQISNPMVL